MKNKEIHYPYYCKKCTRTVYYGENDIKNDICKCCGLKMEKCNPIITHPKDTIKNVNKQKSRARLHTQNTVSGLPNIPTPKCPTCQSTNIQRISTTSKMFDIMLVGHFSRAARSQFKCNSCGYMW